MSGSVGALILVIIILAAVAFYTLTDKQSDKSSDESSDKQDKQNKQYHYRDALKRSCQMHGGRLDSNGHCYACPPGYTRSGFPTATPRACAGKFAPARRIF